MIYMGFVVVCYPVIRVLGSYEVVFDYGALYVVLFLIM